jgi:hypothetical protein
MELKIGNAIGLYEISSQEELIAEEEDDWRIALRMF